MGLRERKNVDLIACPSCGRAEIDVIAVALQAQEAFADKLIPLQIAVMGCSSTVRRARDAIRYAAGHKRGHCSSKFRTWRSCRKKIGLRVSVAEFLMDTARSGGCPRGHRQGGTRSRARSQSPARERGDDVQSSATSPSSSNAIPPLIFRSEHNVGLCPTLCCDLRVERGVTGADGPSSSPRPLRAAVDCMTESGRGRVLGDAIGRSAAKRGPRSASRWVRPATTPGQRNSAGRGCGAAARAFRGQVSSTSGAIAPGYPAPMPSRDASAPVDQLFA